RGVGDALHLPLRLQPEADVDDERHQQDEARHRDDHEHERLAVLAADASHSSRSVDELESVPLFESGSSGRSMFQPCVIVTSTGLPGCSDEFGNEHCSDARNSAGTAAWAASHGSWPLNRATAAALAATRAASVTRR